jgi:hypothetical protein
VTEKKLSALEDIAVLDKLLAVLSVCVTPDTRGLGIIILVKVVTLFSK